MPCSLWAHPYLPAIVQIVCAMFLPLLVVFSKMTQILILTNFFELFSRIFTTIALAAMESLKTSTRSIRIVFLELVLRPLNLYQTLNPKYLALTNQFFFLVGIGSLFTKPIYISMSKKKKASLAFEDFLFIASVWFVQLCSSLSMYGLYFVQWDIAWIHLEEISVEFELCII